MVFSGTVLVRLSSRVEALRRAVDGLCVTLAPMTVTVLHLTIHGIVQGVGYRWNMVQAARRRGVTGWVRNRHDGCVEAVVSGPRDVLDELIAWARRGPSGARVDKIDVEPGEGTFTGFEQWPSA